MTAPAARHRGPPQPPRLAPWIYWTAGAGIILGGAAVALASWLAPSPEAPDGTDPPRRSVSQSAAIRTLPPLNVPTTLPVADETTPQSTLSARSASSESRRDLPVTPTRTTSAPEAPAAPDAPPPVDEEPIPPDEPAADPTEEATMPAEEPSPTPTDPTPSVIGDLIDDVAGEGL